MVVISAELKGPRKLLRIRLENLDFEPDLGLKLGQTKPKIPGTVLTDRHTTTPNDSGQISACFDDDPKLFNCEITQSSDVAVRHDPGSGFFAVPGESGQGPGVNISLVFLK